jgi:hypothetical protein
VRAGWTLACAALAAAAALAPIPPTWIDRWYWGGAYPPLQRALTRITNLVPLALFDVLLAGTLIVVLVTLVRMAATIRRRRWNAAGAAAARLVLCASVLYLWFLGVWGFNYRKSPIESRLAMRPGPTDPEAVRTLGRTAVEWANALHAAAHASGGPKPEWRNQVLEASFAATLDRLGHRSDVEPGRLKNSLAGPYFRWTGVDGMISPFTLEVLGNPDLLPFERPFVAAHEWSHLAGYADEAEASFVGWLACVRADQPSQYSAWLFLLWQIRGEVPRAGREALDQSLAAGPRGDMAAVAERLRRGTAPALQRASWAAYDSYLKANRVEEGVHSYSRVLDLLTRAQFEGAWRPMLRNPLPGT